MKRKLFYKMFCCYFSNRIGSALSQLDHAWTEFQGDDGHDFDQIKHITNKIQQLLASQGWCICT